MKNFIIDVDDVILQYVPALINYFNKKFNLKIKKRQIKSWEFSNYIPLPKERVLEVWEEFIKDNNFHNLRLVNYCREGIKKLSEYGNIYLVTYRSNDLKEKTEKNLNKLSKVWKDLIFTNKNKKIDICKKLDAFLIVDDSPISVREAKESNIISFLFDQPWNKKENKYSYRVKNWKEILFLIENNKIF
ncbi:MAG: hypothetical protein QW117_00105 [Candidatus Pacearchaeota archaeon]